MGPQPPSLPHTGASRRARRSPFADTTKGVWCRLPPQLLSRSSYAWFWPSFYWKLPIHSAARFSAAPDTETRFPCLQTRSGAQNTGDRAQARRKAPEVPERAVVLATGTRSGEDGVTGNLVRPGVGVIGAWFAAGYGLYPRVPVQQCSGLAVRRPEMGEAGSDSGLAGAPDLYLDFPHGRRVSYRIGSVLAVPHLSTMTPVIRTLPRAFEVFCRHAGPSASVVHTLATLREDNFDAVGPKRRLTPFCPIRGRTVVRKGDGLFDCIGFNNPGQFSYFVRDDNKYHFRLLCVSSTSLSNYFHNPATSTSLIHDRCGAPAPYLSEWPRLKIEIALDLQPQGAANRFEF